MKTLEKIEFLFYFYFGKFVTKNRAFGNNTIFLQQFFFGFGGGGDLPPSPWLRSWFQHLDLEAMKGCEYVCAIRTSLGLIK